jgi:hypothetical protein
VRRWLQVSAMSAGVGAALVGWSLLGPDVSVSAADSTSSSSSASAGPSHSNAGAKKAPGIATSKTSTHHTATTGARHSPRQAADTDSSTSKTATSAPNTKGIAPQRTSTLSTAPTLSGGRTLASPTAVPAAAPTLPTTHQQQVAKQIDDIVAFSNSVINGLPVDPATRKWLQDAALVVRRTVLNQDPTVTPIQVSGKLTGPITGQIGAVDADGDKLVYRIDQGPKTGTVVINNDGTYTYTPIAGFDGVDTFTVTADDLGMHINLIDLFDRPGTQGSVIVNQGAIKYNFIYGPNDQYWTTDRQEALNKAADALTAYLVVTKPVVLDYTVKSIYDKDGKDKETLGSASSPLIGEKGAAGFYPTVIQNKLQTGVDANGATADGEVTFNFANTWDLSDAVSDDAYDFKSTAMHELLHSFGFYSEAGDPEDQQDTAWSTYDSFIVTADGTRPIAPNGVWNKDYDNNLMGANGGLYFNGPNSLAAYGKPVPLFTPPKFAGGSSMSHLSDPAFTVNDKPTVIMVSGDGEGQGIRVLSPVEIGILRDLGYMADSAPST